MNTANFENKASCIMYIFSLLNRFSTNHIKIDKYSFLSRYIQDFDFLGQKKSLRRLDGRGHFWTSIWFPLRLRALYREKRKYSNFITKIYWFFFYFLLVYVQKYHFEKFSLIWWVFCWPSSLVMVAVWSTNYLSDMH